MDLEEAVKMIMRDLNGLRAVVEAGADAAGGPTVDLTPLMAKMDTLDKGLAVLAKRVEEQDTLLAEHTAALEAVAGDEPAAPLTTTWLDVDPDDAATVLTDLARWLDDTLRLYAPEVLTELAVCWPRHPTTVQLLLDLESAWQRAYRGGAARILEVWDIRTRYLPETIASLKTNDRCRYGNHVMPDKPAAGEHRPPAAALDDAAAEWMANRPPPPAPVIP